MNTVLINRLNKERRESKSRKEILRQTLANFTSLQAELNELTGPWALPWLEDLMHWEAHHGRRRSFMRKLYTRYNRLRFEVEWEYLNDRALNRPPGVTVVQ